MSLEILALIASLPSSVLAILQIIDWWSRRNRDQK